ncbi:MAG: CAP domain-containing protein [Myxococcales bacterium]|nr:CAP domain-containing protein [Myxococcales bacterium]
MWGSLLLLVVWATPSAAVERLLDAHGWGVPARDPALDAAAAALAARLAGPVDGAVGEVSGATLAFVLAEAGVGDAQVHPYTVRYRASEALDERLPALLSRLDRRLPPTHYGVGSHGIGSTVTTTWLVVHRGVAFDPAPPRTAPPGSLLPLRGELRRGYFKPRVLVAPPGGAPVRVRPAWAAERAVEVTLYFDAGPGTYGVEVVAESQYGPVVLYNRPIHVGVEPPARPVVRLGPAVGAQEPGAALVGLINRHRAERGLGPLVAHPALGAVAAEHAAELARRRSLLHASPDTGTLATRLRAQGFVFERIAENLADAADPRAALQAFLDSPGHARNLLLPGLTHVGVGVEGRFFAVALAGGLRAEAPLR